MEWEDEALVLALGASDLGLQRGRELAHERSDIIFIPAELLAYTALVEIWQLGHFGGSELIHFPVRVP